MLTERPQQSNLAFIDTPGLLGAESPDSGMSDNVLRAQLTTDHYPEDNSEKKKRSLVDGIARKHLMSERTTYVTTLSETVW